MRAGRGDGAPGGEGSPRAGVEAGACLLARSLGESRMWAEADGDEGRVKEAERRRLGCRKAPRPVATSKTSFSRSSSAPEGREKIRGSHLSSSPSL